MTDLNKRALEGLAQLVVALGLFIFVPAWSLRYWQAWVFLFVFTASVLAITVYLMKHDPKLLEKRVRAGAGAEKKRKQKIIQGIASVAFVLVIVFPALDHRFGWSRVPVPLVAAGDALVALGLLGVFFVFRANSFTSAVIEVDAEQKVVSTGLYAVVRHPMYACAFVMLLGVPLALGSWWGLLAVAPLIAAIVWRLLDEEGYLVAHLPGYAEYRAKVRYRLIPFVW